MNIVKQEIKLIVIIKIRMSGAENVFLILQMQDIFHQIELLRNTIEIYGNFSKIGSITG